MEKMDGWMDGENGWMDGRPSELQSFSECAPKPLLLRLTKQKQIHIKYAINIHSALSLLFDTFH